VPLSKADVPDRITLRYFNCRGRGQALRYLLIDHGVEFADERIEAGPSWVNDKGRLGGPFASLPVLHWAGDFVAQTLPIATFGHESSLRTTSGANSLPTFSPRFPVGSLHLTIYSPSGSRHFLRGLFRWPQTTSSSRRSTLGLSSWVTRLLTSRPSAGISASTARRC